MKTEPADIKPNKWYNSTKNAAVYVLKAVKLNCVTKVDAMRMSEKNRLTAITQIEHKQHTWKLVSSSVLCINADALTHNRTHRCTIRAVWTNKTRAKHLAVDRMCFEGRGFVCSPFGYMLQKRIIINNITVAVVIVVIITHTHTHSCSHFMWNSDTYDPDICCCFTVNSIMNTTNRSQRSQPLPFIWKFDLKRSVYTNELAKK